LLTYRERISQGGLRLADEPGQCALCAQKRGTDSVPNWKQRMEISGNPMLTQAKRNRSASNEAGIYVRLVWNAGLRRKFDILDANAHFLTSFKR
jgi:hypothetical protein